jgi:hypothetical protein
LGHPVLHQKKNPQSIKYARSKVEVWFAGTIGGLVSVSMGMQSESVLTQQAFACYLKLIFSFSEEIASDENFSSMRLKLAGTLVKVFFVLKATCSYDLSWT